MEIVSAEGLRQDGRTVTCLRKISCLLGLYDQPNGSAYIEMGNTKVLAAVYGPHEVSFLDYFKQVSIFFVQKKYAYEEIIL